MRFSSDGNMENRFFPLFCYIGVTFANALGVSIVPILLAVEYFPTYIRAQVTN